MYSPQMYYCAGGDQVEVDEALVEPHYRRQHLLQSVVLSVRQYPKAKTPDGVRQYPKP